MPDSPAVTRSDIKRMLMANIPCLIDVLIHEDSHSRCSAIKVAVTGMVEPPTTKLEEIRTAMDELLHDNAPCGILFECRVKIGHKEGPYR